MYQSRIKNGKKRTNRDEKRRLCMEPDEGQEYAIAKELIGNGRINALCSDGKIRLARIRGSMRKSINKVLIDKGDLILITRRDFEEDKVDIIFKFTREEATKILHGKNSDIAECLVKAWTHTSFDVDGIDDDNIVFKEDDEVNVDEL